MEYKEAEKYMEHIKQIRREIRLLKEQIERDTVLAAGVKGIRYDIDRVQTTPQDRLIDFVLTISTNRHELQKKMGELQARETEARKYLLKISEDHERVLVLYYMQGYEWSKVAEMLSYSEKYIYEIKVKALQELEEVLTKSD